MAEGDIKLVYNYEDGHADIVIEDRDLVMDTGLETAVLVSLNTNRRAGEQELNDLDGSREGWWGDNVSNGFLIGSKLWLGDRLKLADNLITKAQTWIREALQWMIDDGVASKIQVDVIRVLDNDAGISELKINVGIQRPSTGNESVFYRYFYNWQNQILRRA